MKARRHWDGKFVDAHGDSKDIKEHTVVHGETKKRRSQVGGYDNNTKEGAHSIDGVGDGVVEKKTSHKDSEPLRIKIPGHDGHWDGNVEGKADFVDVHSSSAIPWSGILLSIGSSAAWRSSRCDGGRSRGAHVGKRQDWILRWTLTNRLTDRLTLLSSFPPWQTTDYELWMLYCDAFPVCSFFFLFLLLLLLLLLLLKLQVASDLQHTVDK
jgi:hypothetical protein